MPPHARSIIPHRILPAIVLSRSVPRALRPRLCCDVPRPRRRSTPDAARSLELAPRSASSPFEGPPPSKARARPGAPTSAGQNI
ncbi:hypothetical protein POSPLADRAFT_1053330 [Postia placenta MAD-698-R-SB12]|uniref:Uncharacterized protein n=1 Tax=Postia placenta MAD-698-R-SB12 TaxID=670580 RepID=A0A1X6NDW4_9APHY|nr:hypothetical protein POSPLADRAFT_1053330 [Postia placenta MAD-698-R-SB12]OSX66710.1 hypothetical protein POSPLADRAFT_1053330 [Postia placenta MAD-698-R-SB12]